MFCFRSTSTLVNSSCLHLYGIPNKYRRFVGNFTISYIMQGMYKDGPHYSYVETREKDSYEYFLKIYRTTYINLIDEECLLSPHQTNLEYCWAKYYKSASISELKEQKILQISKQQNSHLEQKKISSPLPYTRNH